MVTLLAYTPDERWAFVQDGGRVVLVRPPFHQDVVASEAEVERAVTIHGFVPLERDFPDRHALLDFLSKESVRVWNESAPSKNLPSLRDELLAAFTIVDLDRHLERAQKKLDAGKLDEAQTLLNRLLTAQAVTHPQRRAIAAMQEHVQSTRREQEQQRRRALRTAVQARFQRIAKCVSNDALARGAGGAGPAVLRPAA